MTLGLTNAEEVATLQARVKNRGAAVHVAAFKLSSTTKAVTSISVTGQVATVSCTAHGYTLDQVVGLTGFAASFYNDHFRIINVPNANSFQISVPVGTGAGATGTAAAWVEAQTPGSGGYARAVTAVNDWNDAVAGAPSTISGPNGTGTSGGVWSLGTASTAWGTLVGYGLWDNTAGAFFCHGKLTNPIAVNNLDPVQFDTGNTITIQGGDTFDPFS